jgi:hypothetical protein
VQDLKKIKPKSIKYWFYNHNRSIRKPIRRYGHKWTLRQVVYHLYKAEAIAEMENLSGEKVGSKAALGQYQNALKYIMDGLTRRQMVEAEAEMKKWNEEAAPKHVQAR